MRSLLIILITLITVQTHAQDSIHRKFNDAFDELNSELALRFYDALNGKPLSKAQITFKGVSKLTNTAGKVVFKFPEDLPPDTNLPVKVKKRGYVTSTLPVHFMVGTVFNNQFSISPSLDLGKLRIVLDWGRSPSDLDAHLVKHNEYHISYRHMKSYAEKAWLDRDDRDGNGPETITVVKPKSEGHYDYYVQDYTQSGFIGNSHAHVHVYSANGISHSFQIKPKLKGNRWHVFSIKDGQIVEP